MVITTFLPIIVLPNYLQQHQPFVCLAFLTEVYSFFHSLKEGSIKKMFETRNKHRPSSPQRVSWLEFLLNPSMLEPYLVQSNTDPSATDLIIKFLSNSMLFSVGEGSGSFDAPNGGEEAVAEYEAMRREWEERNRTKRQALRLLALKVAAFLRWDLHMLEKKLPLSMMQALLTELLVVTKGEEQDARFASLLYHVWVLRAIIEGTYPTKNQRVISMQLPGQVDPTLASPILIENILKKLSEECEQSLSVLEAFVAAGAAVRMPLVGCIGALTEEGGACHTWQNGLPLQHADVLCQVSYSLGCYYFFHEFYLKANKHFTTSYQLYAKLEEPAFCRLDPAKLRGFCGACVQLLGRQRPGPAQPLHDALHHSVQNKHNRILEILKIDNYKEELAMSQRDTVELNILHEHNEDSDMALGVVLSNALRSTLSGRTSVGNWSSALKAHEERASLLLCELLKDVMLHITPKKQSYLKMFIRMLCVNSVAAKQLLRKQLAPLFSAAELDSLYSPAAKRMSCAFDKCFTEDYGVQVAGIERRLLSATEAVPVRSCVHQLRSKRNYLDVWTLNKKWEIPVAVNIFLKSVPATVDQEIVHILLAKATEFRNIQRWAETRHLFQMIHAEARNASPRLSRFLGWEQLRTDLLEMLHTPPLAARPDITQRVLTLLASQKKERDVPPDSNLMELCAAVFLNFREWDKLIEVEHKTDAYIQFGKILAAVCKEVLSKEGKSASKSMWEAVLSTFSNSSSSAHKRTASGAPKEGSRESSTVLLTRHQMLPFIKKLQDTLALDVMISCLAKFYNILKDDSIGEIFLEHQALWPTTINNSSSYNMGAVSEVFQGALAHALAVHPTHTSWLRTKGDVLYVQGQYAGAMRLYIQSAMVCSDHFSLQRPLLDVRHIVHCSTKLHNHTQAAIVHQFLEEANYGGAVKSLGERVCCDSCDAYYGCVWDTTLLEFLVHHHTRRGEVECRRRVLQLMGQLELNASNNEEIQREAAALRRGRFLRAIARQYL